MPLKRFSVKGFKNCRQEIVLENMGEICVIHGENNIGKSNILEAMRLFFLLNDAYHKSRRPIDFIRQLEKTLQNDVLKINEIFTFGRHDPIEMSITLACQKEPEIILELSLQNEDDSGLRFNITNSSQNETQNTCLNHFLKKHFALIGVDRQINETETEKERCIVPQSLLLQLYDIKDSPEPAIFEKWELFVSILQEFEDVLGEGEFIAVFDRESNRANLVFQPTKPRRRIPIELLGSGIQQVIALIARLLVSDADFIAIEEPELNLRYTLQLRLRKILGEIIKSPLGPQQLFLTSHSPAFEYGDYFYAMKATDEGPIIEHLPIKQAPLFTKHNISHTHLAGKTAPQCYVTSEGLVKLPEETREELGIKQGGGIVILKRKDNQHVELLTDEQYFDLLEPIS